jgi:zona occludens toxin
MIVGRPGAGKTYEAVAFHILPALEKGRKVITNLPLNVEHFAKFFPEYLPLIEIRKPSPGNLKPFSRVEDYQSEWRHPKEGYGALFVVDECHIPLPVKGTLREVEEWYSLHRHSTSDILLITQGATKVNKPIRDLAQVVYILSKNIAIGSQNSYVRKTYDGLKGNLVNQSVRKYDATVFPYYQSHTQGGGKELNPTDITPLWKRWFFWLPIVLFSVVAYLFATRDIELIPTAVKAPSAPVVPAKESTPMQEVKPSPAPSTASDSSALVNLAPNINTPEAKAVHLIPYIKPNPDTDHPLNGAHLQITGALVTPATTKHYIRATYADGHQYKITTNDLMAMGYAIQTQSECFISAYFGTFHLRIFCP